MDVTLLEIYTHLEQVQQLLQSVLQEEGGVDGFVELFLDTIHSDAIPTV